MRANVAFFPIDARGLVARFPAGMRPNRCGRQRPSQRRGPAQPERCFQDSQETLYTLAADTGGKALLDSNDLVLGIRQVQHQIDSYYILAYEAPTRPKTANTAKYR